MVQENECDFIISFGGGSPHDCAKAIGVVATNGGDYISNLGFRV